MTDGRSPAAGIWSLSQPSARRSLILCALGALIGLAIAGVGLFTAKGTRTSAVPAEDAALVNQVPILMSDYVQQLRALYDVPLGQATPEQKRKTLDGMVREELYVQRGVELGLQSDTIEVRDALVGAVEAQTAADAHMAQPTEAELRAYYAKNMAAFAGEGRMELADYLLPANADRRTLGTAVAALKAAGPNTAAADKAVADRAVADGAVADRVVSRSGRMKDGEEYYFAARIHLGARLFAVARGLGAGQVSPPVAMPDGVHLIVMKNNVAPVAAPFEEVRDKVLAAYVDAQAKLLTGANERFLRKRADIQVARGYE